MREKLLALVVKLRAMADTKPLTCGRFDGCADEIEYILAESQPPVRVKPGWIAKDKNGTRWFQEKPVFEGMGHWYRSDPDSECVEDVDDIITDPWPDKPNGGPECILEVK